MDRARSKATRALALAGLAVAFGLVVLAWRGSGPVASAGRDDPYSSAPVDVEIGERGYAVPRNYLSHVTRNTEDGRDMIAVLLALWPGLEPRTRDNNQFWRRRYPTRQIRILINERGMEGHQQLQNVLYNASRSTVPYDVVGEPASYDLLEYSYAIGDGSVDRHFVVADASYLTPAGLPVTFNCTDPTSTRAKELFDVELLCKAEYQLEDGAWLYFSFFMVNLEHWREIDTAVRALIDSFRR